MKIHQSWGQERKSASIKILGNYFIQLFITYLLNYLFIYYVSTNYPIFMIFSVIPFILPFLNFKLPFLK